MGVDPVEEFKQRNAEYIAKMGEDSEVRDLTWQWFNKVSEYEYSYHFRWMDRPIIQFPQDMVAMQEIIWNVKPDLIIETGIAHGGSIIFSASMLELLGGDGEVIGIDIDIREHNREAIESHPMFKRITMIEDSSVADDVVERVRNIAAGKKRVMVFLDSNHTHEHVAAELQAYADMVTVGSYLVVFDTCVEYMPADFFPNRPWGHGDNPYSAVKEFMKVNDDFEIDQELNNKLLITVAPDGYLRRVK